MKLLHFIDWGIIASYLLFLIWIGIIKQKNQTKSQNNFILSGRNISLIGFIATLVTTWYGAILGIGENTLLYGFQTWFIFALPYYIFAIIYAIWVAPKIRERKFLSIPDQFYSCYGESSGIIAALIIIFLSSPAPYLLSLGILLKFLFGIELGFSLIISAFFSTVYIWNGGFTAVIKTDKLQFILMFSGFSLLFIFLWYQIGHPLEIIKNLPPKYVKPLGGNSLQYVLVWFFIAAWTFVDPGFYQRCAAAKNPVVAKKGILFAVFFWGIFDFLTMVCGLYAIGRVTDANALLSYPILAINILPFGFLGLFITGILATIMSTIDSLSLINSITFGRDILWRIEKKSTNSNPVLLIKKSIIITSFISLCLAFLLPSVIKLFYVLGSLFIPGLILPFIFTFSNDTSKVPKQLALKWITMPVVLSILWYSISQILNSNILDIEPFFPGMILSILFFIYIKYRTHHGN